MAKSSPNSENKDVEMGVFAGLSGINFPFDFGKRQKLRILGQYGVLGNAIGLEMDCRGGDTYGTDDEATEGPQPVLGKAKCELTIREADNGDGHQRSEDKVQKGDPPSKEADP